MTQGGIEPHERDPHPLFGHDDDHDHDHEYAPTQHRPRPAPTSRAAARQRKRSRRIFGLVVVALVAIVAATAIVVWPHVSGWFSGSNDCGGKGNGTATVDVHPNDGAQAIADELCKQGVVTSAQSFLDAAEADAKSANIQPGSYTLPTHIAAKQALTYLLDDKHRVRGLLVPEGATVVDVEKRLTQPPCAATSPANQVCGLGASAAEAKAALRKIDDLGLPQDYYPAANKQPISPEGFLYPLTYNFGTGTSAADALQQMVNSFIEEVRNIGFTDDAKALHLTPYQALTIASIAQAEAYFPQDMPKVTRVIINRLAAHMPLQVDATSAYAAKLKGLDPTTQIYADVTGPYNTYKHDGLPPTPISNPGEDALKGAVHPANGNWLFYVNMDKAGHLFFTNSEAAFERAVAKCRANHWGCG